MKRLFVAICFALFFICSGQTKVYPDVDFNVTKEINGLLYFKADTTLVTGRVIRYNRKKVAKRYIMVRNGKQDGLGWAYFDEEYESPKESALGNVVSFSAWTTAVVMDLSGNDIDVPNPINPVNMSQKIFQNDVTDILDYNKEIAVKANDDMLQRNEILKNITSDREIRNELTENNSKNDQLETNVNHIDDKKNGIWEEFYPNGNLEFKGVYVEGEKDGLFEEYYENGQLKRKINFKKGKKDGIWEQYHPNGEVWGEGHHKVGRMIGEWTYYDENGKQHLTETYENGKLIKTESFN
ncbi:toxin-antitoxin system YwqK family antitoxin [Aestuariivivens sediminis]|uniref:toxin-antitoxin system YwqK family antitoxin n=1 Tax=Aestuariivivens sediminis TaxID=2913557 RepID=UPI001F55B749|nr:toxin-antitoxin system YwqK family antitoxin [Aestuariivivens sediminis]